MEPPLSWSSILQTSLVEFKFPISQSFSSNIFHYYYDKRSHIKFSSPRRFDPKLKKLESHDFPIVSSTPIRRHNSEILTLKSFFGKRSLWRRIFFASKKVRSIILLNFVTIVYASSIPVVKEVEELVDPAAFNVVRFAMTAIPFIPFVWHKLDDVKTRNAGIELGFWVGLGYLMQAFGLLTSDAGRASFISMLTVLVVPFLDGLLGAVVPARTWFGAFMSVIGVAMLESSGSHPCVGDLLNFLSSVFFGVHMLRTEHISRHTEKENFLPLLAYEVCVVAILSTLWYFLGRWVDGGNETITTSWNWKTFLESVVMFPWMPALYTGLFSTGLCLWLEGMFLLWLTATIPQIPQARPHCAKLKGSCDPLTVGQLVLLYSSLGFMSIGAGGLRSSSLAFGADQLKSKGNPTSGRLFESYISWYYVSVMVSVLIGMTVIVYIQDSMGWKVGFGVPAVLMFVSVISFFASSSLYVKSKPTSSLLTGLVQVVVASYKKRDIRFSDSDLMYHHQLGSNLLVPTEKLRFLNKACIIRNQSEELTTDGRASDPWSLCTIDQVEELKALIKIIPIWSSGIVYAVTISQNSVSYLQVASMDRHITSNFEIPAGSFGTFSLVALIIWVPIYDRILLPLASKIMRKPVRFNVKQRIGAGIIFMSLSSAISAIVESYRRSAAIEEGFYDNQYAVVNMTALWLMPMYVFCGVAEALNAIGQNEFYMSELPRSMSSIATSLLGLNLCIGNLVASLIMTSVDEISKAGGRESWVSSNINKGHCDYYYWLLCGINSINFLYFLVCCKGYGQLQG